MPRLPVFRGCMPALREAAARGFTNIGGVAQGKDSTRIRSAMRRRTWLNKTSPFSAEASSGCGAGASGRALASRCPGLGRRTSSPAVSSSLRRRSTRCGAKYNMRDVSASFLRCGSAAPGSMSNACASETSTTRTRASNVMTVARASWCASSSLAVRRMNSRMPARSHEANRSFNNR
jgi:hypothetical protein